MSLFGFIYRRMVCLVRGHTFKRRRVYCPMSKLMESGYRCERCNKEQVWLARWQECEE